MTMRRREFLELALAGAVLGAATPAFATDKFGHSNHDCWTPRPTDLIAPAMAIRLPMIRVENI